MVNIVILGEDKKLINELNELIRVNINCLSVRPFFNKDDLLENVDLSEVHVLLGVVDVMNFENCSLVADVLKGKNHNVRIAFLSYKKLEGWIYRLYNRNIPFVKIGSSYDELLAEIRKVISGSKEVLEAKNPLTPTEEKILHLTAKGMTQKEISETLHSSLRTIESHMKKLRIKLGVESTSRSALGFRAVEKGYVSANYEFSEEF